METPDLEKQSGPVAIPELFRRLADDLKTLAVQQLRLAAHEVQFESSRLIRIAVLAVSLVLVSIVALVVTTLTLAVTLHELAGWPLWASYGAVSVLLLTVAGALGLTIKHQAGQIHVLPVRTLHTLKEDTQWIKEQLASLKT